MGVGVGGGGGERDEVELRDKVGEAGAEQQIAIYPLGMNKTTSNEEMSLDHTKAKCTKLLSLPYCFRSFPMKQSTQHQKWSYLP
jgi:hypothetical protein